MTRLPFVAGALGACLGSSVASAQAPPWAASRPAEPRDVGAEPPQASGWPAPRPARVGPRRSLPARRTAPEVDADPGAGGYFQMPTARLLRHGDVAGTYLSALGWVGVRYGAARTVDLGVGVPYYFAGLTVDARVAFAQRPGLAAAWWFYASVPLLAEGDRASSSLGFTWAYAGVGWLSGPLVTLWGERVTASFGLHVAQRTGLGGVWLLSHATLAVRIIDGVKALAQAVMLYEAAPERAPRAEALLGNGAPRIIPYALAGARLYTRRFAADLGVLAPLGADAPLYSERLPVIPWIALQHLF
ncbi:MAG: hypothetical protein U0325_28000 [Polyangiales bacterium]